MIRLGAAVACFLAALSTSSAVHAAIITASFSGEVRHINDHGNPFLDGSIALGTSISGTYSFDPDVLDSQPGLSQLGAYRQYVNDGANFNLGVGNYGLIILDGYYTIQVENDTGVSSDDDKYEVGSGVGSRSFSNDIDTFADFGFVMSLRDFSSGDVFSDDSLPRSLELVEFDDGQGEILITVKNQVGGDTDIIATVTSLHFVPEPSSFGICGIGAIGLLIGTCWRRLFRFVGST